MSKLKSKPSNNTRLFQQPAKNFSKTDDDTWHNGKVLGKNTLGTMMVSLQRKCGRMANYTNFLRLGPVNEFDRTIKIETEICHHLVHLVLECMVFQKIYVRKTMLTLSDETKFLRLGPVTEFDRICHEVKHL